MVSDDDDDDDDDANDAGSRIDKLNKTQKLKEKWTESVQYLFKSPRFYKINFICHFAQVWPSTSS